MRRFAFTALALTLPFFALAGVEVGLRLLGFGGYPPVILDVGAGAEHHWYSTHRPGTDTFFSARSSLTGGMRELHFVTPKPPDTVRIVLLGGSAAQGFPQPLPLTNGSFLRAMLQDLRDDGRNVEVLNFGATAVASFPVLAILERVLEHEPDLVVVMTGNNEFYGAYGVASVPAICASPIGLRCLRWLRGLAITQALSSLRPEEPPPSGKLMEQMAVTHRIAPDDRRRRAAAATLRGHLETMVRRCRERDVPIVLCTIPTNERDLAPIGEDDEARRHYDLARSLTAGGRHQDALEEYVRARDLDPMPWRAPSFAREAVISAARAGGVLCDMEAAFRAESPGGAIGRELMDDHVHMSLAGQALFAGTIARLMGSMGGALQADPAGLDTLPDWEAYADRLGRSVYTDYVAATRIRSLFQIPFMNENNPGAARRAEDRRQSLFESMSEQDRAAVERWRDPSLHGATDRPLTYVVGVYRMSQRDYETAESLFLTARASVPAVSLWRLESTWKLLDCRRHRLERPTATDLRLCQEVIAVGELLSRFGHSDDPDVRRYLGLAYNLAGDHARAVRCLGDLSLSALAADAAGVVAVLVDSYLQLGRIDSARDVLSRAMEDHRTAETARRLLSRLDEGDPSSSPAPEAQDASKSIAPPSGRSKIGP